MQMKAEENRTLTAAEQRRLERFEALRARLEAQGWSATNLVISVIKANVFAVALAFPLMGLGFWLFFKRNGGIGSMPGNFFLLFLIAFIALIFVHEGLHGVTWALFAENGFKDIAFGFMKELLTPYCTCAAPLKKGQYILGALMPLIVLGIIPTALGILFGSMFWTVIGLVMVLSAGGDILIVLKLLLWKSAAAEKRFLDHPTQAGLVVFER